MNASPRLTCARAKSGRRRLASRNAAAACDLDQRRGRPVRAEVLAARDVDLLAIPDVLQEHGDLAHVGERRARRGKALLEILVHLAGLRDGVVAAHRAPLGVRRDAARDEDESPRLDDVGEVADGLGHSWNPDLDRKSTRLNSSHQIISYAVFCLKKKT